jgi:hypothetical protein
LCFAVYKSPSETLLVFEKEYGKATTKKMEIYKWHKNIHDGCASVNDDPCLGQLSTPTNDKGNKCVHNVVQK